MGEGDATGARPGTPNPYPAYQGSRIQARCRSRAGTRSTYHLAESPATCSRPSMSDDLQAKARAAAVAFLKEPYANSPPPPYVDPELWAKADSKRRQEIVRNLKRH